MRDDLRGRLRSGDPEAAEAIFQAWREAKGSWREVAAVLGIPVRTLFRWRCQFPVLRPVRPGVRWVNVNERQLPFSFERQA